MMTAEERVRVLGEAEPNSWLAFSSDESRVVGRGKTYGDAVRDAEKHGEEDPVLVLIPKSWDAKVYSSGPTLQSLPILRSRSS
jgi:hypothetical protein